MIIGLRFIGSVLAAAGLLLFLSAASAGPSYISSAHPPADTLEYTIPHGEAFVTSLPSSIESWDVDTYQPVRVPAESWTAGRAFYWTPPADGEGRYELTFVAHSESEPVDTLVMVLDVQPE